MDQTLWGPVLPVARARRRRRGLDGPASIVEMWGAILSTQFMHVYVLEANTADGLRVFNAIERQSGDPQSDEQLWRRLAEYAWPVVPLTATTTVFSWSSTCSTNASFTPAETDSRHAGVEFPKSDMAPMEDEPSAERLLEELRQASSSNRRAHLILDLEPVAVAGALRSDARELLRAFVQENRDSNTPATLVAVASAIRKYIGTLDSDQWSEIGFILEPKHRAPVLPEIELEVTKMIVRKLSVSPPPDNNTLAPLGDQLLELTRTYVNPRLLPRQHYGAIALNGILALTLLRIHTSEVHGLMKTLQVRWFKELVLRRAQEIGHELAHRLSQEAMRLQCKCLESLAQVCREDFP